MRRRRTPAARALTHAGRVVVWLLRAGALLVLVVPIALVVGLSFARDAYVVIPPSGYSLRWYANIVAERDFLPAFVVSLEVALIVTAVSVSAGTLAACGLYRWDPPGRRWVELALASPVMVPLVVTGAALLVFLNRLGVTGAFWNIVIGHVLITFPYVVRTVSAALSRYDAALDEAASGLGGRPWDVFWRITLPIVRPGIFAGALFAFVMSFDDFTVTVFLIGADMKTLPVAIYQYMEWNLDPTVSAVSAALIGMAVAATLVIERFVGLDRFLGIR